MAPRIRRAQGGFTYLGLIILVTVIGLVGAATLKIDALLRRAAGRRRAARHRRRSSAPRCASYAAATPKGQPPQPPSLAGTAEGSAHAGRAAPPAQDFRRPGHRQRRSGASSTRATMSACWRCTACRRRKPLKIGNFDARFVGFENKQHLSDWKFTGGLAPVAPAPAGGCAPARRWRRRQRRRRRAPPQPVLAPAAARAAGSRSRKKKPRKRPKRSRRPTAASSAEAPLPALAARGA